MRGRREKSQRRPMRKEEGRRRREPKLLILKHAQQRPWPWALVTLLPLFSWLGNGHISPSARTSETGEGTEDRSTYWPFNTHYVTKLTGEVGGIRTPRPQTEAPRQRGNPFVCRWGLSPKPFSSHSPRAFSASRRDEKARPTTFHITLGKSRCRGEGVLVTSTPLEECEVGVTSHSRERAPAATPALPSRLVMLNPRL